MQLRTRAHNIQIPTSLQTHPIQAQPINTPRSLNHAEFVEPLLPSSSSAANIPLFLPARLFEPLARTVAAPPPSALDRRERAGAG
jgi:hypothetical protein